MHFEDSKATAEAAAELANKAVAAAEIAAYMAMKHNNQASQPYYNDKFYNDPAKYTQNMTHKSTTEEKMLPCFFQGCPLLYRTTPFTRKLSKEIA
ncbi:IST1 protein [Trifolium repens]|nr:IST1 protein [Trifolium repens]